MQRWFANANAAMLEVKTAFRVPVAAGCLFFSLFDSQNVKPDQTANEHFIEII